MVDFRDFVFRDVVASESFGFVIVSNLFTEQWYS